jgi:GNAT superfamily N-acetyltransferase
MEAMTRLQIIREKAGEAKAAREAARLMEAHEFVADAWPGWDRAQAARQTLEALPEAAELWAALEGGRWQWMAARSPLEFDSKLFGSPMELVRPIAHREPWPQPESAGLGRRLFGELSRAAFGEGAQALVARVGARDVAAAQALEGAGFRLTDVSVEWQAELAGLPAKKPLPGGAVVRAWHAGEEARLQALAAESFCDLNAYPDRFAMDPRLRPRCPELYRRWLANSLPGDQADQVLVLEREGELLGFISLKLPAGGEGPQAECGWVVLNAIAPEARGRGLYHGLLHRGLAWLAKRRAARARVRTKLTQGAVVRAWAVLGGRQVYSDLTFHLWADQAPA